MSFNLTGQIFGGNVVCNKAGLAAGTTTTYSIANQTDYAIGGVAYRKASVTNGASPTVDGNTGAAFKPLVAGQACVFVFALDAAGAVSVTQGPVADNNAILGGAGAAQFPGIPDAKTPIGYLLAQAGATLAGNWTFGASNLSGVAGMTYTFRDVIALPPVPVAS
jgi:hypothetical protein